MTEHMTVEKLANYLSVNKRTIYRLLEKGKIPATKVGHQWRFNKTAIDEWLQHSSIGTRATILVVDDEIVIQSLFRDTLEELGHRVIAAKTSFEGLELVKEEDIDLVFLDLKLPGMNGAELFQHIKAIKPNLPVTIITGYPESEIMARALAQGPFGVMNKPFNEDGIITAVNNFLKIATKIPR